MKVYFGSDNHGCKLRPELIAYVNELGYKSDDLGMNIDFPVIAKKVVKEVLEYQDNRGVLICGTGQGVAIASNRHEGIRAAVCNTVEDAKQSREHLNANILTLGADRVNGSLSKEIVQAFLSTAFIEEDRYKRRIRQMK